MGEGLRSRFPKLQGGQDDPQAGTWQRTEYSLQAVCHIPHRPHGRRCSPSGVSYWKASGVEEGHTEVLEESSPAPSSGLWAGALCRNWDSSTGSTMSLEQKCSRFSQHTSLSSPQAPGKCGTGLWGHGLTSCPQCYSVWVPSLPTYLLLVLATEQHRPPGNTWPSVREGAQGGKGPWPHTLAPCFQHHRCSHSECRTERSLRH